MTAIPTCDACGTTLNDAVGDTGCPMCLFQLGRSAGKSQSVVLPSAAELSERLPDFEVTELVGHGGMGAVYRARHTRLDRDVAIKILLEETAEHAVSAERFVRETRALAKLHHNNIVTAFDAGEIDGLSYLVMQFVDGCDLRVLVAESGAVDAEQAIDWIVQAASGLEYAHRKGIVHRDIKPGNLMLDEDSVVRVLDLGLARLDQASGGQADADRSVMNQQLTGSGYVLGTVDFMAPEQAVDTRAADARSDIYSLGCTLYYLLMGRAMFDGDTVVKRIVAHREQDRPALPDTLTAGFAGLNDVYQRMVAKSPEARQQSMTQVIEELEAVRNRSSLPESRRATDIESRLTSDFDDVASRADGPARQTESFEMLDETLVLKSERNNSARSRLRVVAVTLTGLIALLAFVVYRIQTDHGSLVVRLDPEHAAEIDVLLRDAGIEVVDRKDGQKWSVKGGQKQTLDSGDWRIASRDGLKLAVRSESGIELDPERFVIRRNDRIILDVSLEPVTTAAKPAVTGAMFVDSGQTFPASQHKAVTGDLNGDGFPDLVCVGVDLASHLSVFLNDRLGGLQTPHEYSGKTAGWGVELADLDADGDLDAFVSTSGGPEVWLNDGSGQLVELKAAAQTRTLAPKSQESTDVALGDVDGDGDLDAVESVTHGPITARVWLNKGNAHFEPDTEFDIARDSYGIDLGDLDGDGDLDMAYGSWSGDLPVMTNDGKGRFSRSSIIKTRDSMMDVVMADIDRDGDLDLCATYDIGKPARLFLNDGQARFTESPELDGNGRGSRPVFVDLDNDNDLDLVVSRRWLVRQEPPVPHDVWLNDGRGHFTRAVVPKICCESNSVASADLDGDGDQDLIFSTQFSSASRIWLNQRLSPKSPR